MDGMRSVDALGVPDTEAVKRDSLEKLRHSLWATSTEEASKTLTPVASEPFAEAVLVEHDLHCQRGTGDVGLIAVMLCNLPGKLLFRLPSEALNIPQMAKCLLFFAPQATLKDAAFCTATKYSIPQKR